MSSLWNLFGLYWTRPPSPIKEVPETDSDCDTCSDTASAPLPYIPSDHNHVDREGCPNRKASDLIWLNKNGYLAAEEPCYVEHSGKRRNYVLSFTGNRPVCFYNEAGMLVACNPSAVMYDFYGADQLRSSGWCSIHLTNHENTPLCHFRDQHMN